MEDNKMKKEYCACSGETVEKEEHEPCVCLECAYCNRKLTDKNRYSLEGYVNVYVHKKCVIPYLEDKGDLIRANESV